jgi:hypothetical protein
MVILLIHNGMLQRRSDGVFEHLQVPYDIHRSVDQDTDVANFRGSRTSGFHRDGHLAHAKSSVIQA